MGREWHTLTLEELILLTCSTQTDQSADQAPSKHAGVFVSSPAEDPPPAKLAHDDLKTYIILRWCPWFSRAFGPVADSDIYALTARLLGTPECRASTGALEVLTTVALVLTRPNTTKRPRLQNPTAARRAIYRD